MRVPSSTIDAWGWSFENMYLLVDRRIDRRIPSTPPHHRQTKPQNTPKPQIRRVTRIAQEAFLRQLLEYGFMHADPHPVRFACMFRFMRVVLCGCVRWSGHKPNDPMHFGLTAIKPHIHTQTRTLIGQHPPPPPRGSRDQGGHCFA